MRADSEKPDPASPEVEAAQADAQGRLGASLRRLRAERAWGQEEAAWQAQVGIRAYQRLEGGKAVNPTLSTLVRLAVAFAVDVRELLVPAERPPPGRPGRPRRRPKPQHVNGPSSSGPKASSE
jgi:transcriptional regulator with XRE-family HTH domain